MKIVHWNAVFIREEFTSLSIKRTTLLAAEIIYSRDYDVTLGGVAHKSWYLHGVENFAFSQ